MKAKDYRKAAWRKIGEHNNWGMLAVITLVYSLITGACAGLSWIGVGAVALLILGGPLAVGYAITAKKAMDGETVKIDTLFDGFKDFTRTLVLYLLNTIFVFLWTLLLIVPGIIKSYSYSMSYYILIDNPDLSSDEARKKSMEMMKGHKWKLFCLDFSFIGWGILCVLTFGILSFWIQPYQECARVEFYNNLIAQSCEKPEGKTENLIAETAEPEHNAANETEPQTEAVSNENVFADDAANVNEVENEVTSENVHVSENNDITTDDKKD